MMGSKLPRPRQLGWSAGATAVLRSEGEALSLWPEAVPDNVGLVSLAVRGLCSGGTK